MGFIAKFLLFLLIIVAVGGFAISQIPFLKERAIEAINPAAKEARLLGELKANLDELGKSLDETGEQKNPASIKDGIRGSKKLLGESRALVEKISEINSKTGIIGSQIGKIIDAFLDKTPYPADHLETGNQITPSPAISCPQTNP
jgi:dynactin complex subunit